MASASVAVFMSQYVALTNFTPCSGPGVWVPEEQAGRPPDERLEMELYQVFGLARGRCCEEVRAEVTVKGSALHGSIGIAFSARFSNR